MKPTSTPDARTVNPGQAVTYHVADTTAIRADLLVRYESALCKALGVEPGNTMGAMIDMVAAARKVLHGAMGYDEQNAIAPLAHQTQDVWKLLEAQQATARNYADVSLQACAVLGAALDRFDGHHPVALVDCAKRAAEHLGQLTLVDGQVVLHAGVPQPDDVVRLETFDRMLRGERLAVRAAVEALDARISRLEHASPALCIKCSQPLEGGPDSGVPVPASGGGWEDGRAHLRCVSMDEIGVAARQLDAENRKSSERPDSAVNRILDSIDRALADPPPVPVILRRTYRSADFAAIPPGLYELHWKLGDTVLAAVGMHQDGRRWFAPCNWAVGVPSVDWGLVEQAVEVRR